MCPEHQKLKEDGFVALGVCDAEKSPVLPNGNIDPSKAYRTGALSHIKTHVFTDMFGAAAPEGVVVFCDEDVLKLLTELNANCDSTED